MKEKSLAAALLLFCMPYASMAYNSVFFGLYKNLFIILKSELGTKKAVQLFRKIMVFGLKKAYDARGFSKGKPSEFARVVGARDDSVGLKVKFPVIEKNRVVYQFWTDPFPGLKGKVSAKEMDSTYMQFKVDYLLGKGWKYHTTKHFWKGDRYTEHVIERIKK